MINAAAILERTTAASGFKDPAMTDFRAKGTIMGLAGLTAVFGMGTGVAPPVSSPENQPGGVQAPSAAVVPMAVTLADQSGCGGGRFTPGRGPDGIGAVWGIRSLLGPPDLGRLLGGGGGSGWSSGRLLGPVGCDGRPSCTPGLSTWWSSRSLHGQLANGNLVSEGASRLDAFSAYPVPTWLPGDAPSGTAGTPEVGPPQSSRTRGDAPQVSHAHGR